MKTRRDFLKSTILGASTLSTLPGFIDQTFGQMHQDARANQATQTPTGKDQRILVILQLAGGNDGINTVIPYAEDSYHRSRPDLRIDPNQVLKLNDQLGLHPRLRALEAAFKEGDMAVLNGVGYPNPNRSHFKSTDLWSIGSREGDPQELGWIGRYFDHECGNSDAMRAVTTGRSIPLMLEGIGSNASSVDDLSNYAFNALGKDCLKDPLFREMQTPDPLSNGDSNRDFLQRVALDTLATSEQMGALGQSITRFNYPNSGIGRQLQRVGSMIEAGATTRVYYVSHGGFDTHAQQAGRHAKLLQSLDQAVGAFITHMKALKEFNRVALMTFSEFGRQLRQNGTGGTDHGAAAPLFVLGGGVKPGLLSPYPSLRSGDLHPNGDLRHHMDFRQVYAAVLEQFLEAESEKILGAPFAAPELFGT